MLIYLQYSKFNIHLSNRLHYLNNTMRNRLLNQSINQTKKLTIY